MNGVSTVATDAEMVGSEISEGSVDSSRKVELASNENSEMGQQEGVEGSMRLFVGGVTPQSSFESLTQYFKKFGAVKSVEMMKDR